jgi:GNAT superfamily N-acetyltransferase
MKIEIAEIEPFALEKYARVPMAFTVERVLDVIEEGDGGLGGIRLVERWLDAPYEKDYDALPGEGPMRWGEQCDIARWGFLIAKLDGAHVGGAAIAFGTRELIMLEGRDDLAVLWDLRVAREARRCGIGRALFEAAEEWARRRGCSRLKVETQNVNVPACRLYRRCGCTLGGINRFTYRSLPDETQLLWYKDLR